MSEFQRKRNTERLHERAFSLAQETAADLGITTPLQEMIVRGIYSWVYTDTPSEALSPTVAIKLNPAPATPELRAGIAKEVHILEQLSDNGAPLPTFLLDSPVFKDEFVVTAAEYLPGKLDPERPEDLYDYGQALAKLHNISEKRQDIVAQALPFDPLDEVDKLFESITSNQQVSGLSTEFMETIFLPRLQEGHVAVKEIQELMAQEKYDEVIMQVDITFNNARRNRDGNVVLLDLDPLMRGPAELTLGRPLGQWQANFGRPHEWVENLMNGYEKMAHRPLDPEILTRAIVVSKVIFAASPLRQLVSALQQGYQPNDWAFKEGAHRFKNFYSNDARWRSQHEYLEELKNKPVF